MQSDMRVATFNLQNLRLRTREGRAVLDGAADRDWPKMPRPVDLARADRVETAKVIAAAKADVLAFQEVFDLAALDFFHDQFLRKAGSTVYPYRYCLKGNDGHGLNVAAFSLRRAIGVTSHANLTGTDLDLPDLPANLQNLPIFRRDCLEVAFENVTLFICHFKAPYPDAAKAHVIREAEARAVRKIVERRFEDPTRDRWIILGDFNEPARADDKSRSALEVLRSGFAVDLLDRLEPGTDWTYKMPDSHERSRPDGIFVSARLAAEFPDACPQIIRSGMEPVRRASGTDMVPGTVGAPHASDHALIYVDFPGL